MNENVEDIAINPTNTSRFFATGSKFDGGADKMAFFKTVNGGSSWTSSVVNPTAGSLGLAVAINPGNDQVIYVGGQAYPQALLYVSTNGGASWTQLADGLFATYESIRAIAVDPAQPTRVIVGTSGGLYRSENAGVSWTKMANFSVSGICINKNATNEIWASSSSSGMYFSNNGGSSWTAVNDGLEILSVNGLDWSPSAGMVYAATSSGGIYRRSPPIIYAPENFQGVKTINRSVLQREFINVLTWQANQDNDNIIKYRIYLKAGATSQLLAEVDSSKFEYRHRGVTQDGEYTYTIKAVNNEPREGAGATITVR